MSGYRARRVNDPTETAHLSAPRPSATMGDILAWRRKRAGLSLVQIAQRDGAWTPEQVAEVEGCRTLASATVARYMLALERVGQP